MHFSLFFILCVSFVQLTHGIYFVLEEGQLRCFMEEVPKDTLVLGKYRTEDFGGFAARELNRGPARIGVKVMVTDPENQNVLQRDMNPEGRFAFTAQLPGEYKICFQTNTSKWFGTKQKVKFHLDMETGEGATDYEELAKQEHLTALEVDVRRLNDRIRDIRAEQNYQRNREMRFRDTSESTNSRVMWWSIIQTAILVATGMWQISHLKNFFKAKKLV